MKSFKKFILEQVYNIGDYLPDGRKKAENSDPSTIREVEDAAYEAAGRYGAAKGHVERARRNGQVPDGEHLKQLRIHGDILAGHMSKMDRFRRDGHIDIDRHQNFLDGIHDYAAEHHFMTQNPGDI